MARVVLYDGDCGFCTTSVRWLQRLGCALDLVPWQQWPGLDRHDITPEAAGESLHVIDGATVFVGHEAIAAALRACRPGPVRLLGRILGSPRVSPLAGPSYNWVARHRHQLPGGTPACAMKP
jgi:predicted DCC family thiol-disulfide oxidoreductase YuxK